MRKNYVSIGPIYRRKLYEEVCDILGEHMIPQELLVGSTIPRYIYVGGCSYIPGPVHAGGELLSPKDVVKRKFIFKRKLPRSLEM